MSPSAGRVTIPARLSGDGWRDSARRSWSSPKSDWTVLGVRATSSTLDSTWAVMADRLTAPRLDSADIELIRQQYLSAVRQRNDNPDALVDWLADSSAYAGSPYGRSLIGTERSISAMSRATLERYLKTQIVRSRLLIVIVGNATPKRTSNSSSAPPSPNCRSGAIDGRSRPSRLRSPPPW